MYVVDNEPIRIPLSGKKGAGLHAIIDAPDHELVRPWRWHYAKGYAVGSRPGHQPVAMHRLIVAPPAAVQVDHINRDRLDNRRSNLRLATNRQNSANRTPAGEFKGVTFHKTNGRWQAYIGVDGVQHHLGYFRTAEMAAAAYNGAAIIAFGEFAVLNLMPAWG